MAIYNNRTCIASKRWTKAITLASGQKSHFARLATGNGISHSLCGIPRDTDPRVNSWTESSVIAYTPPDVMSDPSGTVTVLSSIGCFESKLERCWRKACRLSARLIPAATLYLNPAAKRSILCWTSRETIMASRKVWLTCKYHVNSTSSSTMSECLFTCLNLTRSEADAYPSTSANSSSGSFWVTSVIVILCFDQFSSCRKPWSGTK